MVEMEVGNLSPIKTGNVEDKSRLKELLFYLVTHRDRPTKTELVKLSFLIDYKYAHTIKKNKSYSTVTYVKYNYGPYADAFTEALEELEVEGKIKNDFNSPEIHKFIYIPILDNAEIDFKNILKDQTILFIIKNVLSDNKDRNLTQIKEMVYSLEEVKKTSFLKEIVLFEEGGNDRSTDNAIMEIRR